MDLEFIVNAIAEKEKTSDRKPVDMYLQHGLMGRVIFYYWFGKRFQKDSYIECADSLLDDIHKAISSKSYIEIPNGILGLGIGLDILIRKQYVSGKSDEILKGLDEHIYRFINSNVLNFGKKYEKEHVVLLLNSLIYFTYRLSSGIENPMDRKVYQMFSFDMLNTIYHNLPDSFFKEPLPFSYDYKILHFLWVTVKLYKMGLFINRIEKIWDEIKYEVFPITPLLQGNCLSLYYISSLIGKALNGDNEWLKHSQKLKRDISIDYIFDVELKNRSVFFTDGIGGMYLLLRACNKERKNFTFDNNKIIERIMTSEIWNLMDSDVKDYKKHAGLDGFCGLAILLDILIKNGKN